MYKLANVYERNQEGKFFDVNYKAFLEKQMKPGQQSTLRDVDFKTSKCFIQFQLEKVILRHN